MAAKDYSALHAELLREVGREGADIVFTGQGKDEYNEEDGTWTHVPPTGIPGVAVEKPGDPEEYEALKLEAVSPVTLTFIPNVIGSIPEINETAFWAGATRTVKARFPIRPAGTAIGARVVLV